MKHSKYTLHPFILLSVLLCITTSLSASSDKLEKITLQLQWKDQFEFAGFYAAKEKGFYKEVGLDVIFKPFEASQDIITEVLEGRADYGLVYSSLINRYLKGDPLIFVANFFKYSPLMLVSQEQYSLPSDLKGKKVMAVSSELYSETIMMMFKKFNVTKNDFKIIEPTFNIQDFIQGKVDAMSVYATNEIYELVKSKAKFNVLNPSAYGIPSYDLNLFTSEEELKNNPQRVASFRAASIKGWEYALKHKEEIIQLIMEKYNSQKKSYEALQYEAKQIHNIMLPSLMPIGSIDPQKVQLIAENFIELKLAPKKSNRNLDRFIYNAPPQNLELTTVEKNYLQSKPEITYCSDPMWMPFSKIKNNTHTGIDADLTQQLSKNLNQPFKLIPTKNWETSLQKVKSGECDLITFATQTPLRSEYLNVSKPLISTPLVLATTIDKRFVDNLSELAGKSIGIVKGYAYKELLTYRFPHLQLIEVENINEGLNKVAKKDLYGFIDNLPVLSYAIEHNHLGAMKISAKADIDLDLGYGIPKDNVTLLSIMNKTINAIDEGDKELIINKWTNPMNNDPRHYYELFGKILLVLLIILLPLLYHYRKIKKDNAELAHISTKDSLSELYNRRYMDEHIQSILEYKKYKHFSLILADIDNFKSVNDTYGHAYGDKVIVQVADILNSHVRGEDIVSRWGGEEFLIFCPNATSHDAQILAERLREIIESTAQEKSELQITCSFGVAEYSGLTNKETAYLQKVDNALYRAKRNGKNRVEVY